MPILPDGTNRDIIWSYDHPHARSAKGCLGYSPEVVGTRDGTRIMVRQDVGIGAERDLEALTWQIMTTRDTAPVDIFTPEHHGLGGLYAMGYGGQGDSHRYLVLKDRVLLSVDRAPFQNTGIIGLPVNANAGGQRILSNRQATDPHDPAIFYVGMGPHGTHMLNGESASKLTWLPDPSSPAGLDDRWTMIRVDEAGPRIGGTGRCAQVAFAPSGEGVWLSEDGGASGSRISPAQFGNVTDMEWRDGRLVVVTFDADEDEAEPAANNVHSWTPSGGWVQHATPFGLRHLTPDPRGADWWIGMAYSSSMVHTKGLTASPTWSTYVGGGAGGGTNVLRQCKIRARPMVALKYRGGQGGYAPGKPTIVGRWLYLPLGYGVLRTPLAEFPTEGANYTHYHPNSRWPTWEEDTAGLEEVVGMSTLVAGDRVIDLGQDVAVTTRPKPGDGHRSGVRYHPAGLSYGTGASHGVDPAFIAAKVVSNGSFVSYSLDSGDSFVTCPNQPEIANGHGDGGLAVAGTANTILVFPALTSPPQFTTDLGASDWADLKFFKEDGTQLHLRQTSVHGFNGAPRYTNHHIAVHDLANPGTYYAVNLGAALEGTAPPGVGTVDYAFSADPLGYAGVYRMTPADFPNFRRVYAGRLTPWGNFGFYNAKLLADGRGRLIFMPNDLPNSRNEEGNKTVVIDLTTNPVSKRSIETPYDCRSIWFGAPFTADGPPTLYMLGWKDDVWGIWIKLAPYDGQTFGPFNPYPPLVAGATVYGDAHKTRPGELHAAVGAQGHIAGLLR